MSNSGDIRGGRVWARMVSYVKNRDPRCKLALEGCTGKSETADHIIPVEQGGTNQPTNLQGACHACNRKRGKKALDEVLPPSAPSGTRIVFDGSDKPSHRVLLEGMGVTSVAFSVWRAWKRGFPKTKPYLLDERFTEDTDILVDSGWMQANESLTTEAEVDEYVAVFDEFVERNAWRAEGISELRLDMKSSEWHEERRVQYGSRMGTVVWPVWVPEDGARALVDMCERYANIVMPHRAVMDPVIQTRIGALGRQFGTRFHALNVADPDTLRNVPLASASTLSWASPQLRGETIIWDGTRLVRYQAKQKSQARSRYKAVVEKAGLDYEKFLADDPSEVTRVAVWSYQQLEKSMETSNTVTSRPEPVSGPFAENSTPPVDNSGLAVRNEQLTTVAQGRPLPARREAGQKATLPVMGVEMRQETETVDGKLVLRDTPVLTSNRTSLRQCDTCVISSACPAYQPATECAFSLPVELRTKEQLKALLNSIIEIQGQRVAFARFAEELNGGYPDPNLSQEMDRLFRLVKQVKDLESNNEFVRLTVERQQAGGVLSQIFGERAATLNQLEQPIDSNDVVSQVLSGESY